MIYTEVLPFVWLGVTLGAAALISLASTLSVFSPASRIGIDVVGELPLLNSRGPMGVPFVDSAYCPSFLEYLVKLSFGSLLSQWWFWPPYLYFVVKVSHSIARGRDCHRLQRRTNLSGKVAIVTGANSGIGYYTALQLAEMGATVIVACRDEAKSQATARQICDEIVLKRGGRKVGGGIANAIPSGEKKEIEGEERSVNSPSSAAKKGKVYSKYGYEIQLRTDFSVEMDDFVSVRRFCSRFLAEGLPLHFLVNNAGMMVTNLQFSKFNPDLELHAAVNFMGPLLLTDLLWEKLCKTSLELSRAAISIDARAADVEKQTYRVPPNTSGSGEDDEDETANPLYSERGLPPCFTMTRSRVVFVASEAHKFPNMDSSFIWRDKVSKRPRNSPYSISSCSPMLEVLQNASKGKSSSQGPIIAPRVSKTMAGFVRYGFSKLFDIYLAHHFVNRGAPASVTELLRGDSTPSPSPATSPTKAAVTHSPGLQITPLVVALHPGLIASSFANNILSVYKYLTSVTLAFQKTSEEGSQTTVFACICNEADAMPHPREANPYWPDESPPSKRRESEPSGCEGTNANNTANKYTYAARYLAECEDYSFSAMKPIAWSLEDARDVVEWARKNVLKTTS